MPQKPKLGQNFLKDLQAVQRIAAALGDLSGRTLVEIGPGEGAITGALAERAGHVIAVELDHELALHLRVRFPAERVSVVEQDVLEFDFAAASRDAGQKLCVAGNLPYGITSQIVLKLAANHTVLDRAVLMVQREVADRIASEPGSRDYGLLSVTMQLYGPVEKLFVVPPGAFNPPPDVFSTVFRWRIASRIDELGVEEEGFLHFVRQAFAQKRKTLANNLRAAGYAPESIAAAIAASSVSPQARAEALPIEALASLWRELPAASGLRRAPDGAQVD